MTRAPTVACILALALVTSAPADAQHRTIPIDSMFTEYARPGHPGAVVLVVDRDEVVTRSYGLAEIETARPVTPGTNFRLASLSKHFTATAITLLVADGKLRYDDALATALPGLPAWARGVTVRQLLHHTSGLPDYEEFVPDTQTAQVRDADVPRLIAQASGPRFAAGTKYDYSNTGYALLALIVERASGTRFADFLRERIFMPLGMTTTVAHEEGRSTVAERAFGYTVSDSGIRRTDQSSTSAVLGDGGIYSSVTDLLKWERALSAHTLVGRAEQELAWTAGTLVGGGSSGYGFGWFVNDDRGRKRLRHHGESRGFTNAILRYPERRLTIVVLTNRTGGAPWDIAQRIAELYLAR